MPKHNKKTDHTGEGARTPSHFREMRGTTSKVFRTHPKHDSRQGHNWVSPNVCVRNSFVPAFRDGTVRIAPEARDVPRRNTLPKHFIDTVGERQRRAPLESNDTQHVN